MPKLRFTSLDLRAMGLERQEVEFLCYILKTSPFITALDMRENGEMGVVAANLLVDEVLKSDRNTVGSLCGVTRLQRY